ncbi:MAG: hypothetical protein QW117_02920 [Candidatus Pacearchaeota archaeon]
MGKKRLFIFFLFLIILFYNFFYNFFLANAYIHLGNLSYDIKKEYKPGENLQGWINISVKDEYYDLLIKGNSKINGSINLFDLILLNSLNYGEDFFCNSYNCIPYYKTSNIDLEEKSITLQKGESYTLAFKLVGDKISSISKFSFDMEVTNQYSCENPLEIDLLYDKEIEWRSDKFSSSIICSDSKNYGCFSNLSSSTLVSLSQDNYYCERIKLKPSKYYNLGAYIINNSKYENNIRMSIFNLDGEELGRCTLDFTKNIKEGEYFCNISLKNEDMNYNEDFYFICIKKTNSLGDYKIKRESSGEKCGFYGNPEQIPEDFSYDYSIFAESYVFDNIGKIKVEDSYLKDYIMNYIQEYYDSSCIENKDGCVIPINFKANVPINIKISNISIEYNELGGYSSTNKIYETNIEKSKISFNYTILNLDEANFSLPSQYGNHTIEIYIGNKKIFNETIKILSFPIIKDLYPKKAFLAYPTKFYVQAQALNNKSIVKYIWNFDPNKSIETTNNSIEYTFMNVSSSNFKIKVSVIDSEGLMSEKDFNINISIPKEKINSTIDIYKKRLQNLTLQISSFPSQYQPYIKKVLNIDNITRQLDEIQIDYNAAGGDEKKYEEIAVKLLSLKIPYKINITLKENLPYYVNYERINLNDLEELEDLGNYSEEREEEYKKAIAGWQQDNIIMYMQGEYLYAYYDNSIEQILGIFRLKISPKEEISREIKNYLIFPDAIKGVNFDLYSSYNNTKQLNNSFSIIFDDIKEREITFFYFGEIKYKDLNLYISPTLEEIEIDFLLEKCNYNKICEKEKEENWKNCRSDCKPWTIAWILWSFILICAFISYILISQWYRIHYESKLFKNRNDIYNLLLYINNAIHQGMTYNTIKQQLSKTGWSSEQISYVINKYQGKSIIPLDISKIFSKRAIKQKNIQNKT